MPAELGRVPVVSNYIHACDCLDGLSSLDDDSVDLVFCSPPYVDSRTYGVGFSLSGQAWVDWAFERYMECVRVCRGLVAWVVEGRTRSFRWDATPALLMADLHRSGVRLRKPPAYSRKGIPGSGGPDWLRNDYEFVVCSSKGRLPWSNNTAMGKPPVFGPGGAISHRTKDGTRVNGGYTPPKLANPGNIIHCKVGGGLIGSRLAHENEAPFPERLAEFFVKSFCPPSGVVLDPFVGSGTTVAVAKRFGRSFVGFDIRKDQIELTERRLKEVEVVKQEDTARKEEDVEGAASSGSVSQAPQRDRG